MTSLRDLAADFAESLTATVQTVVPGAEAFRALADEASDRVAVRQEPQTGIVLTVAGEPLLSLKVGFKCTWDGTQKYLAVDQSEFQVFPGSRAGGEPLFRYDYLREPGKDMPGAHLQIHAHRDGFTHVMSHVGESTPRARRRGRSTGVPRMAELHFPLGGPRFRPCLEDVLEMLVCELGVDCDEAGREALRDGRVAWRRQQVRTIVRDSPLEAVAVLQGMGYAIEPPPPTLLPDVSPRLREL